MRKQVLLSMVIVAMAIASRAQAPQGFSYQAVIRNAQGEPLAEQAVGVRITIQNEDGTLTHFAETHAVTTSPQGVISLNVGGGNPTAGVFADIPWVDGSLFLKLEVDPAGGTSYSPLGTTQLLAVPYALHAQSAREVIAPPDLAEDEPLFVVHNNAGQIVFAVYQTGVRIFVEDTGVKSTKGGFAIGGLSDQTKESGVEYMRVTPDSARIYLRDPIAKATRGGFAIGGLSDQTKESSDFLYLTPDNYFIGHEAGKSNTEGLYNSFLGYKAGYSNTTGNRNTFFGYFSGFSNLEGYSNIFIGDSAGYSNESGIYNIFLGNETGRSNTTGSSNIFIGSTTGYFNETGYKNVFVGSWCGYKNTSGNDNIFMGFKSGWNNTIGYRNVFIGSECGLENIGGRYNVFIGNQAGYSNTTGGGNVIIGATSGYNNTDGYYNVFLGNWSGASNTLGHENIFVGNRSGWYNTEGYKNIFIGSFSGFKNEIGSNNIFFGDSTGYTNTVADNNIFIGNKSGFANTNGSRNVFIGYQSGYSNYSGYNNVFFGNNSGYSNSEGFKNVFIGDSTGYLSTYTSYNIFIGDKVGYSNTEGFSNVIIGATAGMYNSTGRHNTFIGNWSGFYNTTGEYNLFFGSQSGWNNITGSRNVYVGNRAGFNNTEGWSNVFIGNYAGFSEIGSGKLYIDVADTDSTNTLIWGDFFNDLLRINGKLGINTHPQYYELEVVDTSGSAVICLNGTGTNDNYSYSRIVLKSDEVTDKRWDLIHTKSNQFAISFNDGVEWYNNYEFKNNGVFNITSGSIGINLNEEPTQSIDIDGNARIRAVGTSDLGNMPLYITSEGVLSTAASDISLKTNISTLTNALSTIAALRGVHFSWIKDVDAKPKVGFIAQEVEKVLPEVVFTNPTDGLKGVNYAEITAVLVEAVKEQQDIIIHQQSEIEMLKKSNQELESLKTEIETIKSMLGK